jgi:hypothetical protein
VADLVAAHNTQPVGQQLLGREMPAAEVDLEILTAQQIGGLAVVAVLAVLVAMALAVDMAEPEEPVQSGFHPLQQQWLQR